MSVQHASTLRTLPDIGQATAEHARSTDDLPAMEHDPAAWTERVTQHTVDPFEFRAGFRAGVADALLAQHTEPAGHHWRAGYERGRRAALPLTH